MSRFSFFWNRGKEEKDFKRTMALTSQSEDANKQSDPNEYAESLSRASFFVHDALVDDFLQKNPAYRALIPAYSPVNRTTKHISRQDAKIAWLNQKILLTMLEMTMHPQDFENGAMEILQGFEMFGDTQISDGFEGFKAKALTQQTKVIRTGEERK